MTHYHVLLRHPWNDGSAFCKVKGCGLRIPAHLVNYALEHGATLEEPPVVKPKKVTIYVVRCETCDWAAGKFYDHGAARKWATYHRDVNAGTPFGGKLHKVLIEKRQEVR